VGIRLVNVTEQNNTVVAVNNSSTIPVDTGGNSVNTTISARQLSGDVQIETQLYNISAGIIEATDRLNLTVAGPGDLTEDGNAATDPDGDLVYEDVNGDMKTNFEDAVALAFINADDLTEAQKDAVDFDNDGDFDFDDAVELAFV
jgi:hypothetical protein